MTSKSINHDQSLSASKSQPSIAPSDFLSDSQKSSLSTSSNLYNARQLAYEDGTLIKQSSVEFAHWSEQDSNSYTTRMERRLLPGTYTKDSTMLLVPIDLCDTTDTNLRHRAYTGELSVKFDSASYSIDPKAGLRKDLFYTSPYLTCGECNGIVYIDALSLRSRLGLNTIATSENLILPNEELPPCPGCGKTNAFIIGAHDLTHLLASNAEELQRKKRVQKRMILKLQKCYRYYLARRYGRAMRHGMLIKMMLDNRCACAIQAMVRGRMARRRAEVERALIIIKKAHVMLVNRAINAILYKVKVFWYKTKTEKELLFKDYYTLVERTGYNPPLCLVEENIKIIAKRIIERIVVLATRIQCRWRGIVVRRYMSIYAAEVARLRTILAGSAFKIGRFFRGFLGRRIARVRRLERFKEKVLEGYQSERFVKFEKEEVSKKHEKLKAHYTKERQEEKSARFTGLVNPKLTDGKKMKAFQESSYGYDSVQVLMDDFMEDVLARKERDITLEEDRRMRSEWVRDQEGKDFGMKLYFKDEMRERREGIIQRVTKERPITDTRARLASHNEKNIKFAYPSTCYSDPLAILKEEIVVHEVRRDKRGRRVRSSSELQDLAKFEDKRRGGTTMATILGAHIDLKKGKKGATLLTNDSGFIKAAAKAETVEDGRRERAERIHRSRNSGGEVGVKVVGMEAEENSDGTLLSKFPRSKPMNV